ncbi:hypothetical protein ACF0H5_007716 [Mactra antiquata]
MSKSVPTKTWNPMKSFDLTPQELDVARRRQQLMASKKETFRRITLDPKFSLSQGQGGHILEPALQRWYSSRNVFADYYKVDKRSWAYLFGGLILPTAVLYLCASYERKQRDQRARAGLEPNKDKANRAYLFC